MAPPNSDTDPEADSDAFVVWLDQHPSETKVFTGKAEHIKSAARMHFSDREELLRFLETAVSQPASPGDRQ